MEPANTLIHKLETAQRRKLILISSSIALAVLFISFSAIQLFASTTLSSLLRSQNYSQKTQEWRQLTNGVRSGWRIFSGIQQLCLKSERGEILFSTETCPPPPSIGSFLAGKDVHAAFDGVGISIKIARSMWFLAALILILTLIPGALLYWFLGRVLLISNQIQITETISRLYQDSAQLSDFQVLLKSQTDEIIELKRRSAIADLAAQVSHDIRSPLAALEIGTRELDGVANESRELIRVAIHRIRNIANDLLDKHRLERAPRIEEPHNILLSLNLIVNEKRFEYRDKQSTGISLDFEETAYDAFSIYEPNEFNRTLSNLINNAIESLNESGKVELSLKKIPDFAVITIADTGKGISPHILPKLMRPGVTYDKPTGNGLGLFHAKNCVTDWRGELKLYSELGKGTRVEIILPLSKKPEWFLSRMALPARSTAVFIDDDPSIHEIWKLRLETDSYPKSPNRIFLRSPGELVDWISKNEREAETARYICDFEFTGSEMNGLQLIERIGLAKNTILVTSRFDDPKVRTECTRLGVTIVPKPLIGLIPISQLE